MVNLCVGVSSQIWYVDILILSLDNGSNIVYNSEAIKLDTNFEF